MAIPRFKLDRKRTGAQSLVALWGPGPRGSNRLHDMSPLGLHQAALTANVTWARSQRGFVPHFPNVAGQYGSFTSTVCRFIGEEFSVSVWLRPDTIAALDGIVGNHFADDGWWLAINAGTPQIWVAGAVAGDIFGCTTDLVAGVWTHVGLTVTNPAWPVFYWHLNGRFINSGSSANHQPVADLKTQFYIGEDGRDGLDFPYDGQLDDLRCYRRALSAAHWDHIYQSTRYHPYGDLIQRPTRRYVHRHRAEVG